MPWTLRIEPTRWAVVGVAGGVPALSQRRLVARLPKIELRHLPPLGIALRPHALGLPRGLDRHRLYHAQDLRRDGSVRARAAEGEASRQTAFEVGAVASVHGPARGPAGVGHGEAPPAAAAGQHAGEQRPAAAAGLAAARAAIGIGGERPLVPLELGPGDVALVVIPDQHVPGLERLAVAVGLAGAAVDHGDALLAFAVGVGAR